MQSDFLFDDVLSKYHQAQTPSGAYCVLVDAPTIFFSSATTYHKVSLKSSRRRAQNHAARTAKFQPNCYKFRFGHLFVNEQTDQKKFTVVFIKNSRKVKSLTFTIVDRGYLRVNLWSANKGVRFCTEVPGTLRQAIRNISINDDFIEHNPEFNRVISKIQLSLFKLACIYMPWRVDDITYPALVPHLDSTDGLQYLRETIRLMSYPNVNKKYVMGAYNIHKPVDPRLRLKEKDILLYFFGSAGKQARELYNLGYGYLYRDLMRDYFTLDQFYRFGVKNGLANVISEIGLSLPRRDNHKLHIKRVHQAMPDFMENLLSMLDEASCDSRIVLHSRCRSIIDIYHTTSRLLVMGVSTKYIARLRRLAMTRVRKSNDGSNPVQGFDHILSFLLHKLSKTQKIYHRQLSQRVALLKHNYGVVGDAKNLFELSVGNIDEYTIKIPESSTELMQWGKDLGNCIASYAEMYENGTCLLVGLVNSSGECKAAAEYRRSKFSSSPNIKESSNIRRIQIEGPLAHNEELRRLMDDFARTAYFSPVPTSEVILPIEGIEFIVKSMEANNGRFREGTEALQRFGVHVPGEF